MSISDLVKGKTLLLTGASGSIGIAIVKILMRHNMNLALFCRDSSKLTSVIELAKGTGCKTHICTGDISDAGFIKDSVARVAEKFSGIDVLINNAGTSVKNRFEDISIDEFELHFTTNVRAPFLFCQESLPYLKKSERPVIINMSSIVGYKAHKNECAYTTSKHALHGFSKVMAQELQEHGIRVHLISPGAVNTEMAENLSWEKQKMIQADEVAGVVEYLLTSPGDAMIDEVKLRSFWGMPWK
jgi:3-oxoacyl-[acyl-carrier protein] reductase